MSEMVPMHGFGGSGGSGCTLTVTAPAGSTVTVSKDGKTKTKTADSSGVAVFKGLSGGEWAVTITDGSRTASKKVTITTEYAVLISFNTIPDFTYTGDYEIVNDADEPITTSKDNWKIRFLTSGTLTFTALNGAENGIDVFCVGGGGAGGTGSGQQDRCGGGGGYTKTTKNVSVLSGNSYNITVGAGGKGTKASGGASSAFGAKANGGSSPDGGSGGGQGGRSDTAGTAGASDGKSSYGTGQGTTTREFGESSGTLYSGGGGGGDGKGGAAGGAGGGGAGAYTKTAGSGGTNTGGGGGGIYDRNGTVGNGGSGIVIIRNAREVA